MNARDSKSRIVATLSRVRIPLSPPSVFADGKAAIEALTRCKTECRGLCFDEGKKRTGCMYYVYILQSVNSPENFYIGFTSDLQKRLHDHNAGYSLHTKKFTPWKLKNYIAFDDEQKAKNFEIYLKTHSGRKFCKNHF